MRDVRFICVNAIFDLLGDVGINIRRSSSQAGCGFCVEASCLSRREKERVLMYYPSRTSSGETKRFPSGGVKARRTSRLEVVPRIRQLPKMAACSTSLRFLLRNMRISLRKDT